MTVATQASSLPVPQHIAIIMDGNGRWAKKRGLPRTAGHAAGAETFRNIATYCNTLGVKYLTVYAFSTENWKRSAEEVGAIMKLLGNYLQEGLRDMEKNRLRIRFFGDLIEAIQIVAGFIHRLVDLLGGGLDVPKQGCKYIADTAGDLRH